MDRIRQGLNGLKDAPAASFWKYQFLLVDGYQIKFRPVIAFNKGKFGKRIKLDGGGDLCQPTLDGRLLTSDMVPEIRCPVFNYDFTWKTETVVAQDYARFTRAWYRHFKSWAIGGGTPEEALAGFKVMMKGRFEARGRARIELTGHPKYIQEKIKTMHPTMFGHSLWGLAGETADYFKSET